MMSRQPSISTVGDFRMLFARLYVSRGDRKGGSFKHADADGLGTDSQRDSKADALGNEGVVAHDLQEGQR